MDKLIKKKEQNAQLAVVPLDVVSIASLLQTGVPIATTTSRTSSSIMLPTSMVDDLIKLAQFMENMTIQVEELKKLKQEIKVLQEQSNRYENAYLTETQKTQTLTQRVQKMEDDCAMGKTLKLVKENIWKTINEDMGEIWPSIQIIFEQKELFERSIEAIEQVRKKLGDKPNEVTKLIKFLNSKNRQELEELEIEDRTETILEVRKVLTKRNLMRHLEEKGQNMNIGIQRFFAKLEPLYKKGLPNLLVINDKHSTWPNYSAQIMNKVRDIQKVTARRLSMIGRVFLEALLFDLDIQYIILNLFITWPKFSRYTKVDEVYIKLMKMNIPSEQRWDKLYELLE